MRLSPAIDSSPPIPIGFLSLTTRSFLPFSLTTPIPIHFSSPYPYPFRFCLVAFCYGLFVLFLFVHVYIIALWHLASVVSVLEPIYGFSAMKRASRITVDPASGDQPLFNEDKLIVVTVNGEIYNHEDLRKQLTNHTSRTGSDCDVIAHLYVEYELLKGKTLYAFGLVFVYLAICGVIGGVFGLVVVHGVKTSFSWLKCFKVLKADVYLYKRKKKVSTISALSFH